jgi:hypothetical protein
MASISQQLKIFFAHKDGSDPQRKPSPWRADPRTLSVKQNLVRTFCH